MAIFSALVFFGFQSVNSRSALHVCVVNIVGTEVDSTGETALN